MRNGNKADEDGEGAGLNRTSGTLSEKNGPRTLLSVAVPTWGVVERVDDDGNAEGV